jgi:hypothetical protein
MMAAMIRRSGGGASVGVARHRQRDDLMVAVLSVATIDGKRWQFELSLDDVHNLHADLVKLLSASADQVAAWWSVLADGADGRPRPAAVVIRR